MKTTVIAPLRSAKETARLSRPGRALAFARRVPLALAVILAGFIVLTVALIGLPVRWIVSRFRR